jgi:membrane protease YdiL (CAAX protease family)
VTLTEPGLAPPGRADRTGWRADRTAWRAALVVAGLLAALASAAVTRLAVAGSGGVRNPTAGAAFAVQLAVAAWWGGWRPRSIGRRDWGRALGLAALATVAMCAVPAWRHLTDPGGALPVAAFPGWAAVVAAVAVTEELLLRGALWDAVVTARGPGAALVVTTLAFGLLHVPFYGAGMLPLDCAVGVLLGSLRWTTGGTAAPALAHTAADLAGWWLR